MIKQINLSRPHAGKLRLNKKTISNLNISEMSRLIGGQTGASICYNASCYRCGGGNTKNGNTCPGHNTCYTY